LLTASPLETVSSLCDQQADFHAGTVPRNTGIKIDVLKKLDVCLLILSENFPKLNPTSMHNTTDSGSARL
jgi:hypothetical protein